MDESLISSETRVQASRLSLHSTRLLHWAEKRLVFVNLKVFLCRFFPSRLGYPSLRYPTVAPEPMEEFGYSYRGSFEGYAGRSRSLPFFGGCTRVHPLGVAPEALKEWFLPSRASIRIVCGSFDEESACSVHAVPVTSVWMQPLSLCP